MDHDGSMPSSIHVLAASMTPGERFSIETDLRSQFVKSVIVQICQQVGPELTRFHTTSVGLCGDPDRDIALIWFREDGDVDHISSAVAPGHRFTSPQLPGGFHSLVHELASSLKTLWLKGEVIYIPTSGERNANPPLRQVVHDRPFLRD